MSLALAPALVALLSAGAPTFQQSAQAASFQRIGSGGMTIPPRTEPVVSVPQQGRSAVPASMPTGSAASTEPEGLLDELLNEPASHTPRFNLEPSYLQERDIELGGFLRGILGRYENTGTLPNEVLAGMSFANARLSIDARTQDLRVYLSLEGAAQEKGLGWLAKSGEAGDLHVLDAYGALDVADSVTVQLGEFRPPTLFTALLDENDLLFVDRTFNSLFWQQRQAGAQVHLDGDWLEGWLAVQNGQDGAGREVALTGRCSARLFGEGEAPRREGAYDADLGSTLYVGGSWYGDGSIDQAAAWSAEAYFTHEWLALSSEMVDPSPGLEGGHMFWSATGSVELVPETWELAARYEDFRSRSDTIVYRFGLNRYLHGPKTKLQANVVRFEHDGSGNYQTLIELGLVASF